MISLKQRRKENTLNQGNAVVAIYPTHTAAETAVKELQQSGFDMEKLSIVGRDYHTEGERGRLLQYGRSHASLG